MMVYRKESPFPGGSQNGMVMEAKYLSEIGGDILSNTPNYHLTFGNWISRWWFQIFFIFTPTWRNDPIWQPYFSNGLKPPARFVGHSNPTLHSLRSSSATARPWTVSPPCVESQEQQLPPRWWQRCGGIFGEKNPKETQENSDKKRCSKPTKRYLCWLMSCCFFVKVWKFRSRWVVWMTLLSSVYWHSRAFFGTSRLPGNRRPGSGTWRVRMFRISSVSKWCFVCLAFRFSMRLS